MAKYARAVVTMESDTGLAEDRCVNVWHFDGDDSQTWAEDADDLALRLKTFYLAIDEKLASVLSGAARVDIYDLSEPEPRVPKYSENWTLVPGPSSLPTECAVCISMQANPVSGVNQARRRGRVFLGPLTLGMVLLGSGRSLVDAASITLIGNAAAAMAIGPDPGDFRLAVFSPTTLANGGTLGDAFNDVTDIWIDNAFDTQRRRGTSPTTRTHFVPN